MLTTYEFKMISRGDNKPTIRIQDERLATVLVAAHGGLLKTEYFDQPKTDLFPFRVEAQVLLENGFLKPVETLLRPNLMILTLADAQKMRLQMQQLTATTVVLVRQWLPTVKQQCAAFPRLGSYPFAAISLLILSNVLLDNWQIENVERNVVKTERPLRQGKRFYAALMEKPVHSLMEAQGIYGNHVTDRGIYSICRYGNQRYTPESEQQAVLVEAAYLDQMKYGAFPYPVIDQTENAFLTRLALSFGKDFIEILNGHKEQIIDEYQTSIFAEEVSFAEYFMWWYHLFYTVITEELIQEGMIVLPPHRNAFYILLNT